MPPYFPSLTLFPNGLEVGTAVGIVAGTTRTQAGAFALTAPMNRVDTSTAPAAGSTLGDGVALPVSTERTGATVVVFNNTANIINVYGNGTDTINGVAGATGVPLPPGDVAFFICTAVGQWNFEAGVGSSGALPVLLSAAGITAGVTRTQAGATVLAADVNRIDTSTAPAAGSVLGDGVVLPAITRPGLDIVVINNTANIVTVYGNGTDTINGIAGATGIPLPPGDTAVFVAAGLGQWQFEAGVGSAGALPVQLAVDNLTATGTTQGTALALPADFNRVATVAANTGVVLPAARAGLDLFVQNHGANALKVYGNGTDTINDVAGATGVTQMVNSVVLYTCYANGSWYTEGLATGFGGNGLQTVQYADAVSAAGTTQATATPLGTQVNRVTTVAAGAGVNLPSSTGSAGTVVTVINAGANPLAVYPAQGAADTINGVAAATGVTMMVNSVATFLCTVAGTWIAQGLGAGYASSLATASYADGLSANIGGVQAGATPITTELARFTTVGGAGYSAVLPVSSAGLMITVINAGANIMAIFPAGAEQVNGSTNAYPLVPNASVTFYSTLATRWHTISAPNPLQQAYNAVATAPTANNLNLTGANIVGGQEEVTLNLTAALAAGATATLPTVAQFVSALIVAGVPPVPGMTYELYVYNTSSGAFSWTVTTNTGWTLNGTQTVAQNTYRKYYLTLNSLTAATLQSVGQFAINAGI